MGKTAGISKNNHNSLTCQILGHVSVNIPITFKKSRYIIINKCKLKNNMFLDGSCGEWR